MSKEKWARLPLRGKVLLISGLLVILSTPLVTIIPASLVFTMTLFAIVVFYNIYKDIQSLNISIKEVIEIEDQKGRELLKDGKKVAGTVKRTAIPLVYTIGVPIAIVLLMFMWLMLIC